jgi:hypothetical protein
MTVAGINAGGTGTTTAKSIIGTPAVTFGSNTSTSDGFTGSVSNRDSAYTYSFAASSGTVTAGTASGVSYPFTVTGLSAGSSSTVTVTSSRTDYFNGTGSTTGSATAPTPSVSTVNASTTGRSGTTPNFVWANPKASFTWTAANAQSYTINVDNGTVDGTWTTLGTSTNLNVTNVVTNLPSATDTAGGGNRFYRIRITPYSGTNQTGTAGTQITSRSIQNSATAKGSTAIYP